MVRTAVFSEIALVVIALHKRPASTDGSDPAIFVCRMEGATLRPGYLGWFSAVRHVSSQRQEVNRREALEGTWKESAEIHGLYLYTLHCKSRFFYFSP